MIIGSAYREEEIEDLNNMVSDFEVQVRDLEAELVDGMEIEEVVTKKKNNVFSPKSKVDSRIIRVSASTKEVQSALKNAGYYNSSIDGKIGGGTKRAIVEFQKDHELAADGIIGKKTWTELKNYLE